MVSVALPRHAAEVDMPKWLSLPLDLGDFSRASSFEDLVFHATMICSHLKFFSD